MKLNIPSIINIHQGKTAIVVGLGPSAKADIPKITNEHIVISCNDFDLMTDIKPHYWVHANSVDTIQKNYRRYNSKGATIVYADSVDLTPKDIVDRILEVDYIAYDQRHFQSQKCKENNSLCCDHLDKGRRTIQEELQNYTGFAHHYGTGDTVAVHMLALAILLGCRDIYVTGVDLDYSKGYVNGSHVPYNRHNDIKPHMGRIIQDFYKIWESAKRIGTNIYLTSPSTPLKEIFQVKEII